jgi:DNA-binding CsgD family transcriptional regulator
MTSNAPMSERELEILRLVAGGLTNQQIAYQLNISVNTVKVHLRNIFGKIGATSRTEATVYAIRTGLVNVGASAPTGAETGVEALAASETDAMELVTALDDERIAVEQTEQAEASTTPPIEARPTSQVQPISGETLQQPALRRGFVLPVVLGVLVIGILAMVLILNRPADVVQTPTAVPSPTSIQAQPQRWSELTVLPSMRTDFGVAVYDRQIYVIGGMNESGPLDLVERYDPASNTWTTLDAKPTPATRIQAAMIGGVLYVPGGESAQGQILSVLEAYDPRSKAWRTLASLPQPVSRYGLAAYEGRLYLFGGWDGSTFRDDVWIYDPGRNEWTSGARMPTARRDAGAALLEDRIYVVGGTNSGGALPIVERYNPSAGAGGSWENVTPLPRPIAEPTAAGVVNFLIVFGAAGTAEQFQLTENVWISLALPPDDQPPQRVLPLGTTIIVFGGSAADQPVQVRQYQAIYTTFLPGAISP